MRGYIAIVFCLSFQGSLASVTNRIHEREADHSNWNTLNGLPSKIIGHRGEKVLMPEHTLGSYEIACIEEPDYVEPDLVLTKDKQLVCFHDLTLKAGTNIESIPELAHLQGLTVKGDWYIPDLTLPQLKMIKVKQSLIGIRPQYFNDLFQIPTFEEFLELIHEMSFKMKKPIGIVPELKSPEIVNARLDKPNFMENKAVKILDKFGYPIKVGDRQNCVTREGQSVPCGPVILQCFNKDALKYLSTLTDIDLMMLVDEDPQLFTLAALDELSSFVHYYAVWKETLYTGVEAVLKYNNIDYNVTEIEEAGGFIPTKEFPDLVHSRGMELGIYTIYDSREPSKRGCEVKCEPENKTLELFYYFDIGVDAMFVENIAEALEIRLQYELDHKRLGAGNSALTTKVPNYLLILPLLVLGVLNIFRI